MRRLRALGALFVALAAALPAACGAEADAERPAARIRLVTTTSVRDTGLLDSLLPEFTNETGIGVDVVAVGTGAALQHGRDGNADLLLVHDRNGEDQFVADGHGRERRDLMWNTFEICGPAEDPAGVRGAPTGADAFRKIAAARATFVSRGDDSGTHRREQSLWRKAGVDPNRDGCLSTGQGMGATLLVAEERRGYVLTDRGTRLAYRSKIDLDVLVTDAPDLRNDYAIVVLSADRHPALAHDEAGRLAEWFTSVETARRIDAFQVEGEPLFHSVSGMR